MAFVAQLVTNWLLESTQFWGFTAYFPLPQKATIWTDMTQRHMSSTQTSRESRIGEFCHTQSWKVQNVGFKPLWTFHPSKLDEIHKDGPKR